MFKWLRRPDGKRTVAESGERAEPPDSIAELLRIVGEAPNAYSRAERA